MPPFDIHAPPSSVHDCAAHHVASASAAPQISEAQQREMLVEALNVKWTWTGQAINWPRDYKPVFTLLRLDSPEPLKTHHHPFPRFGWVDKGSLRVVQVDTPHDQTFGSGSMIAESIGARHYGVKASQEGVVLRLLDIVPPDWAGSNTVFDPPQ